LFGRLSILCVALFALPEPTARAQSSDVRAATSDSLDLLRRARQAQRNFERIRRANLRGDLEGGRGPCDERIGRFCYWYEPFFALPRPELEEVGRARERLLRALAAAGTRLPGDAWIIGQRVRYLAEHGSGDSAVIVAQGCRAPRWWCHALAGFARHVARDYPGADDAFGRALRSMREEQRCTWTDLSPLLYDNAPYRALPCSERQRVNERVWWLARPFYSRPGNDLRTEHYARHTMALLLQDAETADGVPWGADTRELIVRFGWPTHWSRSIGRPGSLEPPSVLGHEPSPSFWLLPTPALTTPWADVTALRWDPGLERPPARYAPPYAVGFAPIAQAQFARFLRGDTTLTIAAFDLTLDSVFATRPIDVRLAVAKDPATPVVVGPPPPTGPLGVATVRSNWRPAVLSLEGVGVGTPRVARRRAMAAPDPAGLPPLVSDILLFVPHDVLPESLDAALTAALPAPVVLVGQQVGLYWEMYDVPDSTAPAELAVTVTKARSRDEVPYPVGRAQCPARFGSLVTVRWHEEPDAPPRDGGRAIVLDLRSLSRGHYVVSLQVNVAGTPRGCSSREFRIVAR
jgi:hypothetical protein